MGIIARLLNKIFKLKFIKVYFKDGSMQIISKKCFKKLSKQGKINEIIDTEFMHHKKKIITDKSRIEHLMDPASIIKNIKSNRIEYESYPIYNKCDIQTKLRKEHLEWEYNQLISRLLGFQEYFDNIRLWEVWIERWDTTKYIIDQELYNEKFLSDDNKFKKLFKLVYSHINKLPVHGPIKTYTNTNKWAIMIKCSNKEASELLKHFDNKFSEYILYGILSVKVIYIGPNL